MASRKLILMAEKLTEFYFSSHFGPPPKIDLVINIPKNLSKGKLHNDYKIRRTAVDFGVSLLTNARLAKAFIQAFCRLEMKYLKLKSWNEYEAM